jgi:nitrite reductase (cytochrome c-552)
MESARILGSAIEVAAETRRQLTKVLARHGVNEEIAIPDISTKDKAQQVIGLDMVKLRAEKEEFKAKVLPEWDAATKKRESEN